MIHRVLHLCMLAGLAVASLHAEDEGGRAHPAQFDSGIEMSSNRGAVSGSVSPRVLIQSTRRVLSPTEIRGALAGNSVFATASTYYRHQFGTSLRTNRGAVSDSSRLANNIAAGLRSRQPASVPAAPDKHVGLGPVSAGYILPPDAVVGSATDAASAASDKDRKHDLSSIVSAVPLSPNAPGVLVASLAQGGSGGASGSRGGGAAGGAAGGSGGTGGVPGGGPPGGGGGGPAGGGDPNQFNNSKNNAKPQPPIIIRPPGLNQPPGSKPPPGGQGGKPAKVDPAKYKEFRDKLDKLVTTDENGKMSVAEGKQEALGRLLRDNPEMIAYMRQQATSADSKEGRQKGAAGYMAALFGGAKVERDENGEEKRTLEFVSADGKKQESVEIPQNVGDPDETQKFFRSLIDTQNRLQKPPETRPGEKPKPGTRYQLTMPGLPPPDSTQPPAAQAPAK